MPLLEGLDGVNKMSRSLGNYIGIAESSKEIFGKLMSVSDELMWRYFELLSFRPLAEIIALKAQVDEGRNPRDVKFELAAEIVTRFHDAPAARAAQASFQARHAQKILPTDLPLTTIAAPEGALALSAVLTAAGLAASGSEARRKIAEGAVRIDGEKVLDAATRLNVGESHILQLGPRRFARVMLEK